MALRSDANWRWRSRKERRHSDSLPRNRSHDSFGIIVFPLHVSCRPLRRLRALLLRGCLPLAERAPGDGLHVHYRLHVVANTSFAGKPRRAAATLAA